MGARFMPRSLQARLRLMVLGLATVIWIGVAALVWFDAQHEVGELLDGHLAQAAALLSVQADGDDDDIGDPPSVHRYAPQVGFQVFLNDQLVTRSVNMGTKPMSSVKEGFSTIRQDDGSIWRIFGVVVPARDVRVFVGENIESRDAILWAILRSVLWPLALALPLLAVALWWSVRNGLAPLRELRNQLAGRTPQALEPVVLNDCPEEMRPLVGALNELLKRINAVVESERRFTADAAHELRTPIAAIRAQAQVAMGAGDDAKQRTHALQSTLAGCDRATRLVEQLLMLARLEGQVAKSAMPVNLTSVVRRVAADIAPIAMQRAQTLELEADDTCAVVADEALLGVLVRNVVDNALRYSPSGAHVLVTVRTSDSDSTLCVQDSGPGMEPAAIQRLGERFFRVLGSDQPGSGLGWSIVKRLADVFGARVRIDRSTALGGLSVTVVWSR